MMPRWASSKVRKIILVNSYWSLRRRDRETIVKASRSSRRRRRFCQTLSHFANPLDLCNQHFLLDMNFLGTPQLRAGVNVLFFFKVSFLKHPTVHTLQKYIIYGVYSSPKIVDIYRLYIRPTNWYIANISSKHHFWHPWTKSFPKI